jgi:hypothetical protein
MSGSKSPAPAPTPTEPHERLVAEAGARVDAQIAERRDQGDEPPELLAAHARLLCFSHLETPLGTRGVGMSRLFAEALAGHRPSPLAEAIVLSSADESFEATSRSALVSSPRRRGVYGADLGAINDVVREGVAQLQSGAEVLQV